MATAKTGIDALGFYTTSSEAGGVTQRESALCLGGYRSGTEIDQSAPLFETPIAPIRVDMVFGAGGSLEATGEDELTYTPTGGAAGTAVTIAEGETKLIIGTSTDQAVRVTREAYDMPLSGTMTINAYATLESVVALPVVAHAERAAGSTKYRAIMFKAHGTQALTDIKIWNIDNGHAGVTYAVALEAPSSDAIEEVADDTTAPTGPTFDTGTTSGTGLSLASLAAGAEYGLWIRRVVTTDTDASPWTEGGIGYEFVAGGTTYTGTIRGAIRLADTDAALYELYEGEDADPDFSMSPTTTSATLPFTSALTPPMSGQTEFRHVVRQTNVYGIESVNTYIRTTTIDSGGAVVIKDPTAPHTITLEDVGGGMLRVGGRYDALQDDSPADRFAVYYRGDGVDPDTATETPTLYTMSSNTQGGGASKRFTADIGPFASGANVHVIVRTHRVSNSGESSNVTASEIDIDSIVRTAPAQRRFVGGRGYGQQWPQSAQTPLATTVYIDQPNNIYWSLADGVTELWGDSTLILRAKYDGALNSNRGIWTTYQFITEEITGAAGAEPVEVASWTMGDKRLYLTVEGQRRCLIDVTNAIIKCVALKQVPAEMRYGRALVPLAAYDDWHTVLQVRDKYVDDYETVASLTGDGVLALRVPWRYRPDSGDFE